MYKFAVNDRIDNGEVLFGGMSGKGFEGKTHSEETKQMMRKPKNQGEKNSQFGSCWIFDPIGNKAIKISKDDIQSYLDNGYRRGRK